MRTRIHSSVGVLLSAGILSCETNLRAKDFAADRQSIKIEPMPLLEFKQGEDVTIRRMTREEFEAEYG